MTHNERTAEAVEVIRSLFKRVGGGASIHGGVITLGDEWQEALKGLATLIEAGAIAGVELKVKDGADQVATDLLGISITDLKDKKLYKPLTPERMELWEESIHSTDKVSRYGKGRRDRLRKITSDNGTTFTFLYI
jgi:hypothetical protein